MTQLTKPTVRVGVATFVVRPDDGRVLLMYRTGKNGEGTWSPAGGHQEYGETPQQTCARELAEECTLLIDEDDFVPLGFTDDVLVKTGKHYVTLFYGAVLPESVEPMVGEPERFSDLAWFAPDEFPPNLFQPVETFMQQYSEGLEKYIRQSMLIAGALRRA